MSKKKSTGRGRRRRSIQKDHPSRFSYNRVYQILVIIAIITPVVAYFIYIGHYAVNVPYWDEWAVVHLLNRWFAGDITFANLWIQHNESRMLVPYILFLFIAKATSFNTVDVMIASALILTAAFGIMLLYFYRYYRRLSLSFVPVALILFSLSQHENTLWAFQIAWFLVAFLVILTAYLLEYSNSLRILFLGIICATLASYSLLQGLLLWIVGLLYFVLVETDKPRTVIWTISGIIVSVFYFMSYNVKDTGGPSVLYPIHHPFEAVKFFLLSIGSIVTPFKMGPLSTNQSGIVIGLIIFCLAMIMVCISIKNLKQDKAYWIPTALVVFGLLYDLMLLFGRSSAGVGYAWTSRYTIYNLLLLIGVYLGFYRIFTSHKIEDYRRVDRRVVYVVGMLIISLISFQCLMSWHEGLVAGRNTFFTRKLAANILVNNAIAGNKLISQYVYPDVHYFQEEVPFLEANHLSVFGENRYKLPNPKSLVFAGTDTLFSIDSVANHPFSPGSSVVTVNPKEEYSICIRGWAVDGKAKKAARGVFLDVDNRKYIYCIYGIDRPDVAKYFRNQAYRASGFSGTVDVSSLSKGIHNIYITVVSSDEKAYYQPQLKIVFRVE